MRLARVRTNDGRALFALSAGDDGWVPVESLGVTGGITGEVITALRGVDTSSLGGSSNSLDDVEFLNPIVPPTKLLAIGLNYLDHIKENKVKPPENPILFAKFPNSLNDPYGRIIIDPRLTERGDYEVELTVVIGETTKGISEADALSCVFGYTVGNDVSARDWQKADGQFDRSKSFDTFCPIGPWITTADQVPDPQGLPLRSWVERRAASGFVYQGDALLSRLPHPLPGARHDARAWRCDPDRHSPWCRVRDGPASIPPVW